jgi:alcohol dehydrogenase class IV
VKHAIVDPRLAPRVVVLDPELTVGHAAMAVGRVRHASARSRG